MEMGVPSVLPSKVPDKIWTVSLSLRGVTILDCPGRRRSRSGWMSASVKANRGGQPSTTTPTPPPCDSPQVVMRKRCPNVLPIGRVWGSFSRRSNRDLPSRPSIQHPIKQTVSAKNPDRRSQGDIRPVGETARPFLAFEQDQSEPDDRADDRTDHEGKQSGLPAEKRADRRHELDVAKPHRFLRKHH